MQSCCFLLRWVNILNAVEKKLYFLLCFCWKNEIYIVHKWGCRGGLPPETAHREHQIKWLFWSFFVAGTASFEIEKKSRTTKEMRSLLGYILQICLWETILQVGGGGGGGSKSDFLRKVIPARNFLKLFQFCFVQFDQAQVGVL